MIDIEDKYLMKTEIIDCKSKDNSYLLTIQLITGFRHQIRAHLNHLGSPILGDLLYADLKANQLYLHASSLVFRDLNNELIEVKSEPLWIK